MLKKFRVQAVKVVWMLLVVLLEQSGTAGTSAGTVCPDLAS